MSEPLSNSAHELSQLTQELRALLQAWALDGGEVAEGPAPELPPPPNPVRLAPKASAPLVPRPLPAWTPTPPPGGGPGDGTEHNDELRRVRQALGDCERCDLCVTRQTLVFGEGDPSSPVVLVGEGPGAEEDRQGRPFVGAAGRMLTDMIEKVLGLPRDKVYICNVVKCRPPQNRDPLPVEVERCSPVLYRQLNAIRPKLVVALGRFAAQTLLNEDRPLGRLRGSFHVLPDLPDLRVRATYHPAYLLRNPEDKRKVMDDLLEVRRALEEMGVSLAPVGTRAN